MKIGFIHDYRPNLGGTTEIVIRMARALRRKGHYCKLFAHPKSNTKEFDKGNIQIIPAERIPMTFMKYVSYTATRASKIASFYKKGKTEVCHAHYALPYGLSAYLAHEMSGIPYIVTLHGTDVHFLAKNPTLKPLIKLCLENAYAVTSVSNYLKKSLEKQIKLNKEVKIIPNFVRLKRFRKKKRNYKLLEKWNIPRNAKIVTHISNYAKIKNTLIIPEIAKNVNAYFLMVGDDLGKESYELDQLKQKVKDMGLEHKFRFVGRQNVISQIFNLSDVSILSSLNESFGMVLLESMACGCPVVASKVGGIPEFVKHGKHGYLVNKKDIDGFANAINNILNDKKLRKKMSIECIKQGIRYSEEKVMNMYEKLYSDAIEWSRQEW